MILRWNWPMYLKAFLLVTIGLVVCTQFDGLIRWAILCAVASTIFWSASSLAASWWIYDRSHIFDLKWMQGSPGHWLNLHNGLDEIDGVLKARYPSCTGDTLDIFDPNEMTEPSVHESRRGMHSKADQANWRYLPSSNQAYDTVFIVFTAHEFPRRSARAPLPRSPARVARQRDSRTGRASA